MTLSYKDILLTTKTGWYNWERDIMTTDTDSTASVGRKTRSQDPILRWATGLPKTDDFFWDEPLPDHKLNKDVQTDSAWFPPDGMDLADAWVIQVIISNLTGAERHKRWPKVFASKYLAKSYKMKGRPAKTLVGSTWHYQIGFGTWQFHGDEGEEQGFEYHIEPSGSRKVHQGHDVHIGRVCHVQNDRYDYDKKDAEALAKSKKRAAMPFSTGEERHKKEIKLEETRKEDIAQKSISGPKEDDAQKSIFGVITLEDSDLEEGKDSDTQENLRVRLAKAQQKVVLMASTIEKIHRTMGPLVDRLREAGKLMKGKGATKSDQDKLSAFAKENKAVVNKLLGPLNEGVHELNSFFPKMADRIMQHGTDGSTEEFRTWLEAPMDNLDKLEDPGDVYQDLQKLEAENKD